ncbi:uncharacterized protein LOC141649933 [Silene latifolia]|uniref:uncharacterized protein LOC141649933 n=1 Tax=Silene latifolia TaxID=37657 RepID=UPI003D76B800
MKLYSSLKTHIFIPFITCSFHKAMADLGALISIAENVFKLLQSPVLKNMRDWESDLGKLNKSVSFIKDMLLDVETKPELSRGEQRWVDELNEVLYEADDLFDEVITIAKQKELNAPGAKFSEKVLDKVSRFFSSKNRILVSYKTSQEVKSIQQKLDAIAKDHARYEFKVDPQATKNRREETCSFLDETHEKIIGREDDVEAVVDMLFDPNIEENVGFIVVVGIGGLGKTTLAQLVYNHDIVGTRFKKKLWTCVSDQDGKGLDVQATLASIIESSTNKKPSDISSLQSMQTKLQEELKNKVYLLILDDVWTEDPYEWSKLSRYLTIGGRGSRVVITTRSEKTAEVVLGSVVHSRMYMLKGLSDENSWRLFVLTAFERESDEANDAELTTIGKKIVKKCSNVPLAIKVLGTLLYGQRHRWESFEKNRIPCIETTKNPIMSILKLSYNNLEPFVKNCFRYCALFPKDFLMNKRELISLWMAQGFIGDTEDCFLVLLKRCFFQDVKRDDLGDIVSFKMHDLLHDLAQEIAGDEIIVANSPSNNLSKKSCHLFLDEEKWTNNSFPETNVRTCYMNTKIHLDEVKTLVANWRCLRSLRLQVLNAQNLPESIGELLHLRYLDLSRHTTLETLPNSITKLFNLQSLNLNNCHKLKEWPKDFSKLVNLRLLDFNWCLKLTCMPLGINQLTNLRVLTDFKVGNVSAVGKQFRGELKDLKLLVNLRSKLEIRIFGSLVIKEENKWEGGYLEHIKDLKVIWIIFRKEAGESNNEVVIEKLQPNQNLTELRLWGYNGTEIPRWGRAQDDWAFILPNLVKIELQECERLHDIPLLSNLKHLKVLSLYELSNLEYIEPSAISCGGSRSKDVSFFPSLEYLSIHGLKRLRGWWEGVGEADRSSDMPHWQTPFPRLSRLFIIECLRLTSLPPCPSLVSLEVECSNKSLRILADEGPANLGLNLKVRVDSVGYLTTMPARRLTNIKIQGDDDLERLSEFEEVFKSFSFLRKLGIQRCSRLMSISGAEHLTALESLSLDDIPVVDKEFDNDMPWRSLRHNLRSLKLKSLGTLQMLPRGMKHLTALESLSIKSCNSLKGLPDWISCLSSLHSLTIIDCPNLVSLGTIQNITSLQKLEILECPDLNEACREPSGKEWPNIRHIHHISISRWSAIVNIIIPSASSLLLDGFNWCLCSISIRFWFGKPALTVAEMSAELQKVSEHGKFGNSALTAAGSLNPWWTLLEKVILIAGGQFEKPEIFLSPLMIAILRNKGFLQLDFLPLLIPHPYSTTRMRLSLCVHNQHATSLLGVSRTSLVHISTIILLHISQIYCITFIIPHIIFPCLFHKAMADLGTLITIADKVFQLLQSPVLKDMRDWESDLQKLNTSVSFIKDMLLDADTKPELSHGEQRWVDELNEVLYEADDLFDEVITIAKQKELDATGAKFSKKVLDKVSRFFSSKNRILISYNTSQEVKSIQQKLDAIAQDHARYDFKVDPQATLKRKVETCSFLNETHENIIGREADVKAVVDMLLDPNVEENVEFVVVVGIGGLGKTALARLVYNHDRVGTMFEKKLWACVSDQDGKGLDEKAILANIIESSTNEKPSNVSTMQSMHTKLQEELKNKVFLLILDDVWTEDPNEWKELCKYLTIGGRGSRVVITTRSENTADVILGNVAHSKKYMLQGLSDENSWRLFALTAFERESDETNDSELITIGKKIVKKCSNVPLAIKVLGTLLYGQTHRWESFEKNRLPHIIGGTKNPIMPILKLSYNNLEPSMKNCFRYCALFPKDYEMNRGELISLWMAQGYIGDSEDYFLILLKRCFFQDVKRDDLGYIVSFKMHDLMHDLAQEVAGDEIIVANSAPNNLSKKVRHLFIDGEQWTKNSVHERNIRTCYMKTDAHWGVVKTVVANWRFLRSLRLHLPYAKKLPESIGDLLHLRCLDLSDSSNLTTLPNSITNLYNLQSLILRVCESLKEWPKDFWKLVNLRLLDINGCRDLTCMPLGIDQLTNLHDLTHFKVGGVSSIGKQIGGHLNDLKLLLNLRGQLTINIGENLKSEKETSWEGGYLEHIKNLKVIEIIFYIEYGETTNEALIAKLQPNRNLMKLRLEDYNGTEIPRWGRARDDWAIILPNLVKIELRWCKRLDGIPLLSNLKHLKSLSLYKLYNLEYMETNAIISKDLPLFPSLEFLELGGLDRLKGWWKGVGEGDKSCMRHWQPPFPRLSKLLISTCPELTSLPPCPTLEFLMLIRCNKSLRILPGEGEGPAILDLKLNVEVESAGYLTTLPAVRLTDILICFDDDLKRLSDFEEVFKSTSSLRKLVIKGCGKLTSVSGVLEHLTALESLSLSGIPAVDEDFVDDTPWRSLRHSLRSLKLESLKTLQTLPRGMKHLTALQDLHISYCKSLKGLPEWIGCLSSLHSLTIIGCPNLKSLGALQNITSLQKLQIMDCPELREACEEPSGKEWPNIQHIPNIDIFLSCWWGKNEVTDGGRNDASLM